MICLLLHCPVVCCVDTEEWSFDGEFSCGLSSLATSVFLRLPGKGSTPKGYSHSHLLGHVDELTEFRFHPTFTDSNSLISFCRFNLPCTSIKMGLENHDDRCIIPCFT